MLFTFLSSLACTRTLPARPHARGPLLVRSPKPPRHACARRAAHEPALPPASYHKIHVSTTPHHSKPNVGPHLPVFSCSDTMSWNSLTFLRGAGGHAHVALTRAPGARGHLALPSVPSMQHAANTRAAVAHGSAQSSRARARLPGVSGPSPSAYTHRGHEYLRARAHGRTIRVGCPMCPQRRGRMRACVHTAGHWPLAAHLKFHSCGPNACQSAGGM